MNKVNQIVAKYSIKHHKFVLLIFKNETSLGSKLPKSFKQYWESDPVLLVCSSSMHSGPDPLETFLVKMANNGQKWAGYSKCHHNQLVKSFLGLYEVQMKKIANF